MINSWLIEWLLKNLKFIYALLTIAITGAIFYVIKLRVQAIVSLIPFLLFTIFYAVPLSGKLSPSSSLRSLSGVKIFLIAFSWAGVTVLVPAIHHEIEFSSDLIIVFVQRLLFVIAITIPFDIRDITYDSKKLKTLPQVVGIVNAKRLGLVLLMFFLGLNFFKSVLDEQNLRIEFIVTLISLILLVKSRPTQGKYYSAFFVESIPIVWGLLIFLK